MEKQFLDMEAAVIPIINAEQGIKSVALRRRLAEMFPQYTYEQTSGVLSRMMDENKFYFRPSEYEGHFAYELFTILPLNASPSEFGRRKAQTSPKRRSNMKSLADVVFPTAGPINILPLAQQPVPTQQLGQGISHPPLKPFVPTIHLQDRDGRDMVLTLEEARRLYEQLYMHFGARGL